MKSVLIPFLALLVLAACREEDDVGDAPVRGLKTHLVSAIPNIETRRFPAVLEPSEITSLSFEIAGALGQVSLAVGQPVKAGDTLASLDRTTLELQVSSAEAAVDQATSNSRNADDTLERQMSLLERGTVTRVAVDQAQVQAESAAAQLVQAQRSLDTARENLGKADLIAPFDGIISTVQATSFTTVGAGSPIATVYPADSFEVSLSVSFDTVGQLVVGTPATVRLADKPDVILDAVVSEIGARADAVSSFPIVLRLKKTHPIIKAGMAVEAAFDLPAPQSTGFAIPLSAVIRDGQAGGEAGSVLGVFVYEESTSRVTRRTVTVGGISENAIIVLDGLSEGDRIAAAGVSFLKEGQQVRLLDVRE